MKATAKLLLAAAVAAGFTATAEAQSPIQRGDRAAAPRNSTAPSGTSTDNPGRLDQGGHRWRGGGNWGGHRWHGHRWYPGWGFYFGAPLLFSSYYWGHPYAFDHYPRGGVIYREAEPYPQSFPEGRIEGAPSTEVPRGEGAPSQGPLYMNYCESAKAYFPKVTRCPEGWRLETPTR